MNCTIRSFGNTRHTVTPLTKGHDYDPEHEVVAHIAQLLIEPEQTCEVISPKRAVKALKRGADYLLLQVRQVNPGHTPFQLPEFCLDSRTPDGKGSHNPQFGTRVGRHNACNEGITSQGGQPVKGADHASLGDAPSPTEWPVPPRSGLKVTGGTMDGSRYGCKRTRPKRSPSGVVAPVRSVGMDDRKIVADRPHELSSNDENWTGQGSRNPTTTSERSNGSGQQPPVDAKVEGLVPPDRIQALLEKYKHVFSEDLPTGLPPDRGIGHTIRLEEGAAPPYRRHKRMSPAEYELCEKYLKDLLSKGLIAPSTSPFGAPIMIIPKPKGGHRVVCDW